MATTKKRATATASRRMASTTARKMTGATARKKATVVDEGAMGGFTIIEVVLVLAIAGLIFLMVFLAYPALRRSQQDSQRQQLLGDVRAAVTRYQNNNNGRLPGDAKTVHKTAAVEGGADQKISELYKNTKTNLAESFIVNYLNGADAEYSEFVDPTGYALGLQIGTLNGDFELGNNDYKDHMVYIWRGARCDGEKAVKSTNTRDFVVMYKLEGAGTYCE